MDRATRRIADGGAMNDSNAHDLPQTPPRGDAGDEPGLPGGPGDDPASQDAPVGIRIGRNPGNLGDDVADSGDITFPDPVLQPAQI